jgi:hypothetical protein
VADPRVPPTPHCPTCTCAAVLQSLLHHPLSVLLTPTQAAVLAATDLESRGRRDDEAPT